MHKTNAQYVSYVYFVVEVDRLLINIAELSDGQVQASCQSRAGGQPEFRAMEHDNNIDLRLV